MAKKKKATRPAKTLSQKIQDQERQEKYASAVAKDYVRLSKQEQMAVKQTHWEIFVEQYQNIPKAKFPDLVDCGKNEPRDFQRSRGFPYSASGAQSVNGFIAFGWLWEHFARGPQNGTVPAVEASKELRDELVQQQIDAARLKNRREELRLRQSAEEHLPTSRVREEFGAFASMIAKRREDLERKIPDKRTLRLVGQAFEDMADDARRRGEALQNFTEELV